MVNNILNTEYETDAWVYRYFYDKGYYNMDGYFPQAGRNFMAGIVLNF
jgi:iron complex outermembrane receptor protein